jgi:hypothetical protein
MGNIPFVPKPTVKKTLEYIDDQYFLAHNQIGLTTEERKQNEPYRLASISQHIEHLSTQLAAADNSIIPFLKSEIVKRTSDSKPPPYNDKIVDAMQATITRLSGEPYTVTEKEKRRYILTSKLARIEADIPYYDRFKNDSFKPPEVRMMADYLAEVRAAILKELAEL